MARSPRARRLQSIEEGDAMIVDQLRRAGADLSQPRDVVHYLYLPFEEAASTASHRLREAGYTTEVRSAAGPAGANPWLVVARKEEVLSLESARAARVAFTAIAATYGGEYDGWEAAASP